MSGTLSGDPTNTEAVRALDNATCELQTLSRTADTEIEVVAKTFQSLAGQMDSILSLAAEVVSCVDGEQVSAVLPKVQALSDVARSFVGDRLDAAGGILDAVTQETKLLRQLSRATRGQEAIAVETKALSVLTNIEVARLGAVGAGFQYLAKELAEFSKSVSVDTLELATHADSRQALIEDTRRVLEGEIPRLRQELARTENDLGNALSVVGANLTQLSEMPAQFRSCVQDVARQVDGVVAAVQAHDITRQQLEHVRSGFGLIAESLSGHEDPECAKARELAPAWMGLTIQIYQLKSIRETIAGWVSQIRACNTGILQVSASDVAGISARVLEQEEALSSQFARIERLERESQAHGQRIQRAFGGTSNLTQLVTEHLQRSKSVRDHLQLLTFNSIIEASGLGNRAAAILAIAQSIKEVSSEWGSITDRSAQVMRDVVKLEQQANRVMEAFAGTSGEKLREAAQQTTSGLDSLRYAAVSTAERARDMNVTTAKMQATSAAVTDSVDLLDGCNGRIEGVLGELETLRCQLERDHPTVKEEYKEAEVEQMFSADYTTEMEREVLRAALRGADLPAAQTSFAGNSVELF